MPSNDQLLAKFELPYQPRDALRYRPPIGLIGCGGITRNHLKAYRAAGYDVVALCDIDKQRAIERQKEFYPQAKTYTDWRNVVRRSDIQVVDIATHPAIRRPIIEAALSAKKHVLSQKPFVLDLDEGERLVELASKNNVRLAVNQNARWAPHFSFFDYREVVRVYASVARARTQQVHPPLLGQALVEFEDAQASLAFGANLPIGSQDRTFVSGSLGSIDSVGSGNKIQQLTVSTESGTTQPKLEGCWFPDGFRGTMGELLLSVEQDREPTISAANNLKSLAFCVGAVASAERHTPVVPGTVRKMP